MLPPDPMIAYSQTKAMIAERHADSARQRLVAAARKEAGQSAVNRRAHRLAEIASRVRAAVAARGHASPSTEKPGTVVG